VKNIKRGKEYMQISEQRDYLGHYEKLFSLKQINTSSEQLCLANSALLSNSGMNSLAKRYNPTYITTFAMHY